MPWLSINKKKWNLLLRVRCWHLYWIYQFVNCNMECENLCDFILHSDMLISMTWNYFSLTHKLLFICIDFSSLSVCMWLCEQVYARAAAINPRFRNKMKQFYMSQFNITLWYLNFIFEKKKSALIWQYISNTY